MAEAYIVAAARTAGGRRGGKLANWHPADLGGVAIDALVDRSGVDPAAIDDVIFGCVSQAGAQGNNVARNAVLSSQLPESVPATSVDRQCGSSQQAIQFAAQAVMSGTQDIVMAAGVESMTNVPMGSSVLLHHKAGLPGPNGEKIKARYPGVKFSQFTGAEMIAKKYDFSREDLDDFGFKSQQLAAAATNAGKFKDEIVPVTVETENGTEEHTVDEGIRFNATREAMADLKLLDEENGRITAASSSQICDGSSGVLIVSEQALKDHNLTPLARIHHLSVIGSDPVIMLETPIPATQRALERAGMKISDIDLYEVNEAFASVPLAWAKEFNADPQKLNPRGGAIALGHPLGGSGMRLMATMLNYLEATDGRYGLQAMCEGGGLANVTIIERLR